MKKGEGSSPAVFVTVGSVFRFDRLVAAVDEWAAMRAAAGASLPMLAQIGANARPPRHMPWVERLDRIAFEEAVKGARLVIAHAGVGSVVTAAQFARPVVVLPRRAAFGEHTSDHQVETAGWLRQKPGVWVADTEADLGPALEAALALDPSTLQTLPPHAPAPFLQRLHRFLQG